MRRGDELLFFERDILAALGRRESRETPHFDGSERMHLGRRDGFALTQAGCSRLLRKSAHPDARPLLLHLEREAFGPFAKRMENERLARGEGTPPFPESAGGSGPQTVQGLGPTGEAAGRPNNSDSTAR